jgi:hypothetical protein
MAQADYIIANQAGNLFRADLNDTLSAIVSNNSSATEPATMYAYQWWADTNSGLLKQRNAANNGWVTIGTMAQTNLGLLSLSGGAMTGAITTNSTFDGRDISVDGIKLDTIETNATTDQTGEEIRTAIGIPSAVTGHVRAGNTQLVTGTTTLANYNVSNNIAENTWVTVGPTGSGATQIWAALDVLPTTATILLASVFISVTTNSSAQPGQMRFNAASGDVVSPNTNNTQIAAIGFDPASTIALTEQGMIPLGAGRIFKAYWRDIANVVPSDVSLGYRGFMTD